MISAEFDFSSQQPAAPLRHFVSAVWHARGRIPQRRERIVASANAVLLVIRGAPLRMTEPRAGAESREIAGAWLTGPHDRLIFNEPSGETHVVGAVFEPSGVGAIVDGPVDAAQVRARVGLLPKTLQRIVRLRRLLDDLDARKPIRWSSEAVGAGYFDQPHAIREFRALTGMTPVDYVERRRLSWGHELEPGEATDLVPELIR